MQVCHTEGEESYGLRYIAGCMTTTRPLLMTPWVAPDDCCGYCKIEVPTVRIVYWPPQTAAPKASYTARNIFLAHVKRSPVTVVEDGNTLYVRDSFHVRAISDPFQYLSIGLYCLQLNLRICVMYCHVSNVPYGGRHTRCHQSLPTRPSIICQMRQQSWRGTR